MSIVAAFVKILSGKETTRSRQNYGDPDRQTGPGWQPFKHLHNAHWRTISWRSKTRPRHTNTHTYIHTPDEMAIPQARLCLSLLEVEKRRVWKWASERAKKKPRMRCVIQPRHGGLGQQGDQESLPIVHTCHTQACMHARHTEKAGSSTENPICCNICQRKVKMSVNWGYFLHLSLTASHLLSSHPRLWWSQFYTLFNAWGSARPPYAGATRDVSKEQPAGITFCQTNFFFDTDFSCEVKIKQPLIVHICICMNLNLGVHLDHGSTDCLTTLTMSTLESTINHTSSLFQLFVRRQLEE